VRPVLATPFWRALIALRIATLAVAAYSILGYYRDFAHPLLGLAAFAVMAAWTGLMTAANAVDRGRTWPIVSADLAVSVAVLLATSYIDTAARIRADASTIPGIWVVCAVIACGIVGGPWAGLAAGLAIGVADVIVRGGLVGHTTANAVMVLLAGSGVGLVSLLLERAETAMTAAIEQVAASAERERLARGIHDGVLQVLALTQRRGPELGPVGAELGRLAGEQEAALRALIAAGPAVPSHGIIDLRGLLSARAGTRIVLSAPADPVELPAAVARELAAAVGAALDNVAAHAGPGARAWILVEDDGRAVVVTVRDDGPGIPDGRLAEAEAEQRLGVARSIRGRLAELGGSALVTSVPGEGTEVELRIPR
jgi:signal transduction histidine kinase